MTGAALAHRGFRILWIGSIFSFTAHWTLQVALGWVAYELTASAAMLGLIFGIRALPTLALAPLSGVAADRYDRRNLLAASQSVFAAATLALGILLALGAARPWHLFAFVLLVGAAGVFERNARHAIVLDLVPRAQALNAVALNTVAFSGARVFAPAIAGALIVWVGASGNFFLQAAAYGGAAASLFLIAVPARAPRARAGAWASLAEGLGFAWRSPAIRLLAASGVLPHFLFIPVWSTLLPVYAKDVFHTGPQGLGLMFTAVGLGGLLGGLAGASLGRVDRLALVQLAATLAFGLALLGMAAAPSLALALPCVVLAGIGEMLAITANQTLIQIAAPEAMRGRVTSLIAVFPAFISLGSIVVGLGAEALGARGITTALALAGIALCLALWIGSERLRELRVSQYR